MREKNIAFINGKRLNYCSEIQALEFGNDSDTLKSLISGEPTEARPIYGDNFTAYNIPLLMANANQMPYLKDWSYGMRRRICIIPFEVEIPKARQKKNCHGIWRPNTQLYSIGYWKDVTVLSPMVIS